MKEKKIMLPSVEEAKHFVAEATKCDFDIDVFYNRVTIDAKSILGVLSLIMQNLKNTWIPWHLYLPLLLKVG